MFLGLVFTSPTNTVATFPDVSPIVNVIGPIDALTTLNNDVTALPASAFTKPIYREALLDMIDATIEEVEDGAYYPAIKKLYHIEDKIDKWIVAADSSSLIGDLKVAIAAIGNASETTVPTLYGQVAGADAGNNSWIWEGVPYAKPPVGPLRWKAPRDPDPWHGVRQSTNKFSPAVQPNMASVWYPLTTTPIGSEDCLYLNIFRPKNAGNNLPVFVWIHGGAEVFGQASIYNGAFLASQENMIVVVIQYRLGPFGWLYLPALNPGGTAEDLSGNYGTLDTIKAVKWVRDNIRSFGGDPHNITVGGQSAGGFNTLTLLTSPLSQGTFQKAFPMSAGGGVIAPSKTLAYNIAETLLGIIPPGTPLASTPSPTKTDAQIAALLRGASADAIEETLMVNGSISLGVVSPYADGTVITGPFADLISAGKYSKLPIVIGGTEYESKPFLVLLVPQWTNALSFLFAPSQATFENIWTPTLPSGLFQLCGQYDSLEWKAVGVDQLATSMASQQPGNVYAYQFRWGGLSDPGNGLDLAKDAAFLYGAGHATDIPFYFGWDVDVYNLGAYNPSLSLFNSSNYGGRVALQKTMMSYLGNFAATGNPNSSGLPTWKPWSDVSGQPTYNILDATATSTNISMATDSYTKVGVENEVATLPIPAPAKGLIEEFFFF